MAVDMDRLATEILGMVASLSGNVVNNPDELRGNLALKAAIVGHLTLRISQMRQDSPTLMDMMGELAQQMGMATGRARSDVPNRTNVPQHEAAFELVDEANDSPAVKHMKRRLNAYILAAGEDKAVIAGWERKYNNILDAIEHLQEVTTRHQSLDTDIKE